VLSEFFAQHQLRLSHCLHPKEALNTFASREVDLIILDVMMPDIDGFEVCRRIRKQSTIPIIMLTARGEAMDRVVGLELGADDYLPKPFEMAEVVARVRALIRRKTSVSSSVKSDLYRFAGWTMDLSKFVLIDADGTEQRLSAGEVNLLQFFLERPNRLITRDQLREGLPENSDEFAFDRAIDVRVSRLRSKLKDPSKNPKIIKTIYGAGYIFITDSS